MFIKYIFSEVTTLTFFQRITLLNMSSNLSAKKQTAVSVMKKKDLKSAAKISSSLLSNQKKDNSVFKTPTLGNNNAQRNTPEVFLTPKLSTPKSSTMLKSKSTPVIPEKYSNIVKGKDRAFGTPVTHLCSPSLSPKGRRNFIQQANCSVKRFLSDSSLNDSPTPNNGELNTPTSNGYQRDEEASNFVVGVRVRPFTLRCCIFYNFILRKGFWM